jgi:prevent-host-death family protein
MKRTVTATEAKAKLLALLDEVEKGEEIEITRRGRTIARLSPTKLPRSLLGMSKGMGTINATEEELFSPPGIVWDLPD